MNSISPTDFHSEAAKTIDGFVQPNREYVAIFVMSYDMTNPREVAVDYAYKNGYSNRNNGQNNRNNGHRNHQQR